MPSSIATALWNWTSAALGEPALSRVTSTIGAKSQVSPHWLEIRSSTLFLWKDRSLRELPNAIGGNNTSAIALNENGDVFGWASLPGDQERRATLWKNSIMTDLGTLDEDPCSLAFSINARGQVVGISGFQSDVSGGNSGNTIRAFLWERGSMVDLNALIPPNSPLFLTSPETINERGEIAGIGLDSNGNEHGFLLIPCEANDGACQGADKDTFAVHVSTAPRRSSTAANPTNLIHKVRGRRPRLPQL